jgi:hypothetical protein
MPLNGFNTGRDLTLVITDANGPVTFGLITKFEAKPHFNDEKVKGLDGIVRFLPQPEYWSGSFDIERQGPQLDKYFAQMEANYFAGQNTLPAMIQETIQEPDGSVSTFRFLGVMLKFEDAGSWAGGQSVKQRVSFVASRRVPG